MADKLEVTRGIKVEDDTPLVPGKFAILRATPPTQDVEGQNFYGRMTQCPWCGHVGWTQGVSTDFWQTAVCGYCGGRFRV